MSDENKFDSREMDALLEQWHAQNAERAHAGRDQLVKSLTRGQTPLADQTEPPLVLTRKRGLTPFLAAAASVILVAALTVLFVSTSSEPAFADTIYVPEGGRLDARDDDGNLIGPCPLKHTDVNVEISGRFTRVTLTQQYHNPYDRKVEAVYTFPLGHRAAVDRMSMIVGDRVIVGEVKERGEARRIYEAAREQNYVASLLEQERPNIFTQSVANIEPGVTVDVEISYVEVLEVRDGEYRFDFPMVVSPRYIPGSPAISRTLVPAELQDRMGVILLGPAEIKDVTPGNLANAKLAQLGPISSENIRRLLTNASPIKRPDTTWWGEDGETPLLWHRFEVAYGNGARERGVLHADGTGQLNGRWFYFDPSDATRGGAGFASDTDQVPDASRITPMPAGPGKRAGHDISVTVSIDSGGPGLRDLKCELHDIVREDEALRDDGRPTRLTVALTDQKEIPNRDFLLSWRQTDDTVEESIFTHSGEHGSFITLMLTPPARVDDDEARSRELVFVLDCSGSMKDFPIEKAKQVMAKAIDTMRPQDTFNVITFNNTSERLWTTARPNTEANRTAARQYVESRQGGGGTEMRSAVLMALQPDDAADGRLTPAVLADLPADGREVVIVTPYASFETDENGRPRLRVRDDLALSLEMNQDLPPVLTPEGIQIEATGHWRTVNGRRVLTVHRIAASKAADIADALRFVFFLTDGEIGNDDAVVAAVRQHAGTTRMFPVGIGDSPNRSMLDAMSKAGRGAVDFVTLEGDPDATVQRFVDRIATPVLTNIDLAFDGDFQVTDRLPSGDYIPDLFDHTPIIVHARYTGGGKGRVTVTGRTGAGPYRRTVDLDLPRADVSVETEHDVIATLWARTKVDELLATQDRNAVIAIGEQFRLLTPHTSFVAVEKSRVTVGGEPMLVAVPIEMPRGQSWEGTFGRTAIPPVSPSEIALLMGRGQQLGVYQLSKTDAVVAGQVLNEVLGQHSLNWEMPTIQIEVQPESNSLVVYGDGNETLSQQQQLGSMVQLIDQLDATDAKKTSDELGVLLSMTGSNMGLSRPDDTQTFATDNADLSSSAFRSADTFSVQDAEKLVEARAMTPALVNPNLARGVPSTQTAVPDPQRLFAEAQEMRVRRQRVATPPSSPTPWPDASVPTPPRQAPGPTRARKNTVPGRAGGSGGGGGFGGGAAVQDLAAASGAPVQRNPFEIFNKEAAAPADTPVQEPIATLGVEVQLEDGAREELKRVLKDELGEKRKAGVAVREMELDVIRDSVPTGGDRDARQDVPTTLVTRPYFSEQMLGVVGELAEAGDLAEAKTVATALARARPDDTLAVSVRDTLSNQQLDEADRVSRTLTLTGWARDRVEDHVIQLQRDVEMRRVLDERLWVTATPTPAAVDSDEASGSVFGDPGQGTTHATPQTRIEDAIELVTGFVTPEAWDINGGDLARISGRDGRLVYEPLQNTDEARAVIEETSVFLERFGAYVLPEAYGSASAQQGYAESADDTRLRRHLKQSTLTIDVSGTLEEVLETLADKGHVEIEVDWDGLSLIGVGGDDPITLDVTQLPLEQVLTRVFVQVGDELDRPQTTVVNGKLVVSTDESLRQGTITVVYNVGDLLARVGSGSMHAEAVDSLATVIRELVDADGWHDHGGSTGRLRNVGDRFFISNTRDAHREIQVLLGQLRLSLAHPVDPEWRGEVLRRQNAHLADLGPAGQSDIVTIVYDCTDLIAYGYRFDPRPYEVIEQLVTIIQESVDPDGWRDLGGERGSFLEFGGRFIVSNTAANHRDIQVVLSKVRLATGLGVDEPWRAEAERPRQLTVYDCSHLLNSATNPVQRSWMIDALVETIEDSVDTNGWVSRGGDLGAIQPFGELLVVLNTPESHRQIAAFLGGSVPLRSTAAPSGSDVLVSVLTVDQSDATLKALRDAAFRIEARATDRPHFVGWIARDGLPDLALLEEVRRIEPVEK